MKLVLYCKFLTVNLIHVWYVPCRSYTPNLRPNSFFFRVRRIAAPSGGLSLAEGESITVTYEDEKPASTVTYTVLSPLPRFVAPTPEHGTRFETATDCDVQVRHANV